jgi:hypothetical protein
MQQRTTPLVSTLDLPSIGFGSASKTLVSLGVFFVCEVANSYPTLELVHAEYSYGVSSAFSSTRKTCHHPQQARF